ncbi:hypothetical protein MMC28_006613 [Mycoblastus sanguinarius]|nr:hypothetical protein [Mycoblastus sanguinarius]
MGDPLDNNPETFAYSDIKAVILTRDASPEAMKAVSKLLRQTFVDSPDYGRGPLYTWIDPAATAAIGAARAVRAKVGNGDVIKDVLTPLKLWS